MVVPGFLGRPRLQERSLAKALLLLANVVFISWDCTKLGGQNDTVIFLWVTLTHVRHKMSSELYSTKNPPPVLGPEGGWGGMQQLSPICIPSMVLPSVYNTQGQWGTQAPLPVAHHPTPPHSHRFHASYQAVLWGWLTSPPKVLGITAPYCQ